MPHNRAEVEADLRSKFLWIVFDGEYSAVSLAAIALADVFVAGGAISQNIAQEQGAKIGINVASRMAENGFNAATDSLYGGVMTFQNWEDTIFGQFPLPNKFVPYVACRRSDGGGGSGGGGQAVNIGRIRVVCNLSYSVDVRLFHSQAPKIPFATWHFNPGQQIFLATNNEPINIGSDWRLQVIYGPTTSAIFFVGAVATYHAMIFDVNIADVPSLAIGQIRIKNDYSSPVSIRLYHSHTPNQIFATWQFAALEDSFLAMNNQRINIGSDWGIQIVFGNGAISTVRKVGNIGLYSNNILEVLATEIYEG